MAVFDHREVALSINGIEITDWADGSDVINVSKNQDAGGWVMGADGRGVFIAKPDQSGKLVLKLKQHSEDNEKLCKLLNRQLRTLKGFKPLRLNIRDLLNDDLVTGINGYITTQPAYTRGDGHNPTTWTIEFERLEFNLAKGL